MERVGEKLKKLREEKGYTVEFIADSLKLSKKYILYIENCDYNKIHGFFYLKGIIKQYASLVGLNPEEAVKRLEKEMAPPSPIGEKEEEKKDIFPVLAGGLIILLLLLGIFLLVG